MKFKISFTEIVTYTETVEIPDDHVKTAIAKGEEDNGLPWDWFCYSQNPEIIEVNEREINRVKIISEGE